MIVDKLLNDAQEEEAKRLSMQAFRIEPLLWLRDRFGEDPTGLKWSEHGAFDDSHKFDGTPDPLYTAWKHVADGHRRVAIKSATGIGKTYWLSRLTYWFLDCYENSLVIAAGPTVTQLKDNYWTEMKAAFRKFNRLRPNSEIFTNKLVVGGDYEDADDFEKAGWGVVSRSGTLEGGASKQKNNQVKAQGSHREHMLIIVDEAAGVSNALIKTFEATVGAKHNMIVLVGNPDSKYDSLSKFADKPSARAVQASGYDHINVVAGEEIIAGAITNYQIKDFRTDYGEDSAFYKSRVRGIVPDQLDDVLIKSDWIKQCYTEDIEKDDSVAAMGIDVANSELGDKGCVVAGQANFLRRADLFQCPNANHIAHNVLYDDSALNGMGKNVYHVAKIDDYGIAPACIGVDSVGVGVATVNTFIELGYSMIRGISGGQDKSITPKDPRGKPLYEYNNLRTQMLWLLREDIRQGRVSLAGLSNDHRSLLEEEATSLKYDRRGEKIAVESKEALKTRIGRSPDLLDAVMYWNYMRKVGQAGSGVWSVE